MEPETIYHKATEWLLAHGPRILIALIVLAAGQWLLKVFRKWISSILHRKQLDASLRPFLLSLIVTVLQVLLILGVMQILGIQMTVFAALVGGIGVAVGLALSGTLQNFTSGILILLLKPYRVGDNIIAQSLEGKVSSIQIFYTVIITFDNRSVIIPNSKLSNEVIVNLSREGIRRLDIELKFNYYYSFEQTKPVISKTIEDFPGLLRIPEPRIGVAAIELDGYRIAVQVWVQAHGFVDVKLALQEKILADLRIAGLQLPGM